MGGRLLVVVWALALRADSVGPPYSVRVETDMKAAMRDGVKLSTDLYFPAGITGKLPVILIRTPYDKKLQSAAARLFAAQGYAVAVQDVRGKFASDGIFELSANDSSDGADTISWLASQPWATGKVGTYGCSYLGEDQIETSKLRPPQLAAMIPQAAGGAFRYADLMDGGVLKLSFSAGWMRQNGGKTAHSGKMAKLDTARLAVLPSLDILKETGPPTDYEAWVSHQPGDPWWDRMGYVDNRHRFNTPALHIGSWMDSAGPDSLELFNLFRRNSVTGQAAENQFVIVSPAAHCGSEKATEHTVVAGRDMGDARFEYEALYLRWFDHWLKGIENGVTAMPHVRVYVMGANRWRTADEWPLPGTRYVRYFLHSGGHANSARGDGRLSAIAPEREPADVIHYDPLDPVPSEGFPQRSPQLSRRQDVLTYSSDPVSEPIEVTGPIEAVLSVSSSARDTDFIVELTDAVNDGTAFPLAKGILRMRYRNGLDRVAWMQPGKIYRVRINLHATSNLFLPGHRIRIEISSSAFPEYERNLNTGGPNYSEARATQADNSVHHAAAALSYVTLPVVD
jgi:putative CocE/NonD family hydrolase